MKKKSKKPEKKKKIEIVFNPKSRKDFLTGFRKRKNERKKRAKEELERLLKEENKRIKQDIRNGIQQHLKKSYEPIPEVEDILKEEEIEDDLVLVKVKELSMSEMAEKENWLGENRLKYEEDDIDGNNSDDDREKKPEYQQDIPGMSFIEKKQNQKVEKINELKTKKDIDKIKQTQMLKSMKNSKFFKMKQNYDRLMNRKKAKQDKNKQIRQLKKEGRKNPKKIIEMTKSKHKGKVRKQNRHK